MADASQRARGGDTRQRILEVAGQLFAERGYAATSVRDIAAELGLANPSLYYHFKSKAEILDELLDQSMRQVQDAVEQAQQLEGEARLRRVVEALVDSLRVGSGIAMATMLGGGQLLGHDERARAARPMLSQVLGDAVATPHRELRITMAMGAVEAAVREMMSEARDSAEFIARLEARRDAIVSLVLVTLRR